MSDKHIRIVQDIYAAFGRGDVPGIMQHISDGLRLFGIVTARSLVPWHMQVTKKQDVPKFFQALAEAAEFTRFEPRAFAASGDYVYCSIGLDLTFRHNRRKLTIDDEMHRFLFENGKVVEWRGTEDTAQLSAVFNAPAV
jgi:uncharacterized protein